MSSLPRRLKNPKTWLLLFGAFVLLAVLDSFRAPEQQLTARTYIGMVHLYQSLGRPMLKGRVVCRFTPSCSDYSIEAVERHGICHGLVLTFTRLSRCNHGTPLGTHDPVPPAAEEE
ncbi:MAG TPA: membrane protein insertion efficiency factor YidD [Gemmataceae bacterium]|nr:membrane protein insertion efficiency factor YidD [Gemmataceae bacterium]